MTSLASKIATTMPTPQQSARTAAWPRLRRLMARTLGFLLIGAAISIAIAFALAMWADPGTATPATAAAPERGRIWELSVWNSAGAQRIHSKREGQSWSAWQVTGPPDTPMNGDSTMAWCPATADGMQEWLVLHYPQAVLPKELEIHENYAPGAVVRVTLFREGDEEVEVWRGVDPTPQGTVSGISIIPIVAGFKTSRVKIYIDSHKVTGWNEIDAVGLTDQSGKTWWASDVQDSSSYGNASQAVGAVVVPGPKELLPAWCPAHVPDPKLPARLGGVEERMFEARGWPMLAMWTERQANTTAATGGGSIQSGTSARLVYRVTPGTGVVSLAPVLPTRPIWSGLLFNTVFYALLAVGAYWLLTSPRRLVTELLRMRRGCCISCGYELDFDFKGGCPECGWRRPPGDHLSARD